MRRGICLSLPMFNLRTFKDGISKATMYLGYAMRSLYTREVFLTFRCYIVRNRRYRMKWDL